MPAGRANVTRSCVARTIGTTILTMTCCSGVPVVMVAIAVYVARCTVAGGSIVSEESSVIGS